METLLKVFLGAVSIVGIMFFLFNRDKTPNQRCWQSYPDGENKGSEGKVRSS